MQTGHFIASSFNCTAAFYTPRWPVFTDCEHTTTVKYKKKKINVKKKNRFVLRITTLLPVLSVLYFNSIDYISM